MKTQAIGKFLSRHRLIILLTLAFLVGLTYVFTVPPWMHYDEPGHFEYAWLAANSDTWPEVGDYDQSMRREVVLSMIEHRFEDYTGVKMDPDPADDQPINILITQIDDEPVYYFLASLPLRLAKELDITLQLYLARMVSLMLYLFTVFIGYHVGLLLFGEKHPLAWMLPLFLIVLPGFVDIMTAVNNDVSAITAFSLFVWASVLIIQKGINLKHLIFLVVSVLLCYYSKNTAWIAIPLSPLVLLLDLFRGKASKLIRVGFVFLILLGLAITFSWKETVPAYYYLLDDQAKLLRIRDEKAPVGEYVMQQSYQNFYHMLTPQAQEALRGQTVTFGAWIWADQPISFRLPSIRRLEMSGIDFEDQQITLTTEPTFYTSQAQVPDGDYIAWLNFFASAEAKVYWDGMVLVAGAFDGSQAPVFSSPEAESGTWQGEAFTNALRNGSAETGWPLFSSLARRTMLSTNGMFSSSQVMTLLDYQSNTWYYRTTSNIVFKTFWGQFGWGAVPLIGKHIYRILFISTLLMAVGALVGIFRHRRRLPWRLMLFFLFVVFVTYLIVILRGSGRWFHYRYFPNARYLYPVILQIGTFLVWGWYQMFSILPIKNNQYELLAINTIYIAPSLALVGWGILSIFRYYY